MPKAKESKESLSVLFRTPPGDENWFHERILSEVPKSKAEKMEKDFLGYRGKKLNPSPFQLYRYEDGKGNECLVPIDFQEVIHLSVA